MNDCEGRLESTTQRTGEATGDLADAARERFAVPQGLVGPSVMPELPRATATAQAAVRLIARCDPGTSATLTLLRSSAERADGGDDQLASQVQALAGRVAEYFVGHSAPR